MAALVELGEAADAESEKPSPQFASETAGYDLAWRDDKTLALSGLRLCLPFH